MMARRLTLLLVVAIASMGMATTAASAAPDMEIDFAAGGTNEDGTPSTAAGARPFELSNGFTLSTSENPVSKEILPTENIRDVTVELPPGAVGNAKDLPQCGEKELETATQCPPNTQIGVAEVELMLVGVQKTRSPIWNMVPPPGMPVQMSFIVVAPRVHVNFKVRTGTDYGVEADITGLSSTAPIYLNKFILWGVPADPSHDADRGGPSSEPRIPLLSNATNCDGPLITKMSTKSWQKPTEKNEAAPAESPAMTDCNQVDFSPTVEAKPTTNLADSPSGLEFHLNLPQNEDPDGTAEAHLREAKVKLPPGLTINSASGNGLGACTPEQVGYLGLRGERQVLRYDRRSTANFTVNYKGGTTPPIPSFADAAEVMAALETLPGLAGNVRIEGNAGAWIVIFQGDLAGVDVPQMTGEVNGNLSQTVEVTGESGAFNLHVAGGMTGATFESTFGNEVGYLELVNSSRATKSGEYVEGPGIAPDTQISFGFVNFQFINKSTTSAQVNAHLNTAMPYGISATGIEELLQTIPGLGRGAFVSDVETTETSRTYRVSFGGPLGGTNPPITATSALHGPGAGVVVTEDPPPPPQSLDVIAIGGVKAGTPQFTPDAANCPNAAKVGTVRVDTPVLDHPLTGDVFLASPHDNPYDSLLATYLAVADPASGIVLKLPGLVEPDPQTGQLTATFSELPQLPFEDLQVEFFRGATAPLKTGVACGTYQVNSDLTPWTAPEGAIVHKTDTYSIVRGAGGGACAADEASAPAKIDFEAGTFEPSAGVYSPLTLKFSRADGTQQLDSIDSTLPRGLLAKLAGVTYCSDAAVEAARSKSGKSELANPSCPASSRVGNVSVAAGAGPTPFHVEGDAFLAGPYKGAPVSVVVITPAVSGPFDLGNVVVRNALYVDPVTTQVHTVSDRIPSILEGIPLSIRSVLVNLDRNEFTRNPTSCNPLEVTALAGLLSGGSIPLANRFQVGDCGRLGFKPKLALSLTGATKRTGNPALKTVLTARDGDSNISRVAVSLPKSEFLDNSHIKTVCTRVQFAASQCPAGSVYGHARAFTPLLDAPIEGPVYLRSANKLPDLVADLRGQINVVLAGHIDTTKAGGLRATFEEVPDAPVSKFVLDMVGGSKGLLENSKNLCAHTYKATVLIDGHTAKTADLKPALKSSCKKPKKKKKRK
jgi:hypothetical protein